MAGWEDAHWESDTDSGVKRAARRSGVYKRYVPDLCDGVALAIGGDLSRHVSSAERSIRSLNGHGAEHLVGITRLLLRSEAIASSRIEGITPSAQQVALAELGQSEAVRGISDQARHVANNMTIVRQATSELVEVETLTVDDIVRLHRALLPDQPRHHGIRTVQNWIGGSDWSPLDADFVPPSAERVPELMEDLVDYINGAAHAPLIQAAIMHGQFETIHPFTDGNGRVGRALIHTVLARRGLTETTVLPISLVLATLRNRYVEGLGQYRHAAPAASTESSTAINQWVTVFVEAARIAAEQAMTMAERIKDLHDEWSQRLTGHRASIGLRPAPRADSAVARLLRELPNAPVATATTLSRMLEISFPAANAALDELHRADVLHTKTIERGAKAFVARDVLELIDVTERALASTKFDTSASAPNRPVPARGQR